MQSHGRVKQEALLIFDIGKTNKKVLLIDASMQCIREEEQTWVEVPDEEGFPGEDMEKVERWIVEGCHRYLNDRTLDIKGINFSTYGASLIYLDGQGKRLTPLYNYLKPRPKGIAESVYERFGGKLEFCRRTASPDLGMLNSGFQALWLKECKPDVFGKVDRILHFPQYLSYLLTGRVSCEHTSLGCHTALWDFDNMEYHPWTRQLGTVLTNPVPVSTVFPSKVFDRDVPVGIGIHDSSASLVPYLMTTAEPFILVSTGTWCISMNPFNTEPLTGDQLGHDCLLYLSSRMEPVKSSRFYLGHIHDENVKYLATLYRVPEDEFRNMDLDQRIMGGIEQKTRGKRLFFKGGVPEGYVDRSFQTEFFTDHKEAYHQLMKDLVDLTGESVHRIVAGKDRTRNIFISGGFSKNPLFVKLMARKYPGKRVLTSHFPNASSAGAALVLWKAIRPDRPLRMDLGLELCEHEQYR